ncbi:unnamed protein product [Cuscuta campestris]|uniref:SWIM-type domain-containing protein n=1 Tax=Cuscuta campestris TaxID=132261 RepID=A0A484K907_9ASTE|nr:unnamed protein product [Cuscuta campestris]
MAKLMTFLHFRTMHEKRDVEVYVELMAIQESPPETLEPSLPKEIAQLLDEFGAVLEEPRGMPPRRDADHRIFLQPGSKPEGSHQSLPDEFVRGQPVSKPVRVHASRQILHRGKLVQQYLVEWSDGRRDDATWEPCEVVQRYYPDIHLEDKVFSQAGGSDTVHQEDSEPSLKTLMDTVKADISMDWTQNDIRFSYMVALCPPPIVIVDDAELLFYLKLKSHQTDLSYLPLCMEVLPTATATHLSAQDNPSFDSYHSCPVDFREGDHRQATSAFLADLVLHRYVDATRKQYPPNDIRDDMRREFGIAMSYRKALLLVPIAFGVCDAEDKDSWLWFLTHLKTTLTARHDLYIVSDRHEGIIHAVQNVFPNVGHGFCTEHIARNLRVKFKGPKEDLTWKFRKASRAATEAECEEYLQMLDEQDHRIRAYLSNIGMPRWARCKSGPYRYSVMTSNAAESMNNVNNSASEYPICKLVDFIRERMQKWFHERRQTASSTTTILPRKLESELITLQRDAFRMKVKPASPYEFEVVDRWSRTFVVNLRDKSCTCGDFQLDHFVCVHAVAAIGSRPGLSCYNFISPYYKRESLVATYSGIVHPLGDQSTWYIPPAVKALVCKPPSCNKRPPGRPKKRRLPSVGEFHLGKGRKKQKCTRCLKMGHNIKTCKNPIPT